MREREGGSERVGGECSSRKTKKAKTSDVYTIKRYFVPLTVCELFVITICEADKHVFIMF